ncbi:disulfide bond corrector protein DsbC [Mucilaginibacter yixingensis]|uniref:Disulfide bond corrector protein DsbC n=1 Tax=Mucilaginibacter yixingensis TaxID=1295612 RepID=A0A2T5JDL0_9SPHI|nr:protein-disulfide reductase DsbD N-terminal domain-containing protein [Mucilaginibacter yixingensis]PTQ99846.1 disulfide bond corrector protein DsbC [Mucilaginibacter yixingensis]
MKKLLLVFAAMVLCSSAFAQIESHVKWAYAFKKINDKEGVVLLRATIDEGWHIYSTTLKAGGPIKTSFTFAKSPDYILNGKVAEPKPVTKFEKSFGMNVTYFENTVTFQQKVKLNAKKTTIKGKLEFMTCNDQKCLPPDDVDFAVAVAL